MYVPRDAGAFGGMCVVDTYFSYLSGLILNDRPLLSTNVGLMGYPPPPPLVYTCRELILSRSAA